MTLSEQLLEQAKAKHLCDPFQKNWEERSVSALVEFYKSHPDWCLERNYPSLDVLKENFDTNAIRKQGVFVCQLIDELLTDLVYVFNQCSGKITISNYDVVRCYVALESNLEIYVNGNAILLLDVYDTANVNVAVEEGSKCIVYQYGNGTIVGNNITIEDKRHGKGM